MSRWLKLDPAPRKRKKPPQCTWPPPAYPERMDDVPMRWRLDQNGPAAKALEELQRKLRAK